MSHFCSLFLCAGVRLLDDLEHSCIPLKYGSIPLKYGSIPLNYGSIPLNYGCIPLNYGISVALKTPKLSKLGSNCDSHND
jgi:hypothetical protein